MNLKLQIILALLWAVLFVAIIRQIKKRVITIKHSLPWLFLNLILMVLTIFPDIFIALSTFMGVEVPSNMLFFLGFILVLIIEYSHTISISKLTEKEKELAQHIALNEKLID